MKNTMTKLLIGFLLLPSLLLCAGAQQDKYTQLANEIIEAGSEFHGKKIAVVPFSYTDGRAGASKDGAVISERLTMKLINKHKFEIVERAMLDKVMGELKLQSSGIMDADSTQQLGKLLGVQAIITGTMIETDQGKIEVNARLIKTQTAQAVGASQVTLEKDWIGDAASPRQSKQPRYREQEEYAQEEYAPQYAPARSSARRNYVKKRGENEYGFFDIFLGVGAPTMDLEFYNSKSNISSYAVGTSRSDGSNITGLSSIKLNKLKTEGFGLVVMRVGGFGNGNIGGAFEFGFEKRHVIPQNTTWSLDYGPEYDFRMGYSEYLTVTSFYMGGDLLIRFTKKGPVEPYIGFGLGLSLNAINMPYVYSYTGSTWSKPTEEFGLGIVFNVPFGLRFRVGDTMSIVAETRFQMNSMTFDRGITSERDVLTIKGMYFNVGMGFHF